MTAYVTRHITVEAVQWTGGNLDKVRAFAGPDFIEQDAAGHVWVRNAEGPYPLHDGYWVARQEGRPLRVSSPAGFEATFELAKEGTT